VERWLRSVVGQSMPVSAGWPDPSPSAFLVASTTVLSRNPNGLVETWSSAVRSIAETQGQALSVLSRVVAAAVALATPGGPYVVDDTRDGVSFRWVLAHGQATGPVWVSAEPSPIGRRDQAQTRLTFKVRLRGL
jgi:hypothetical protein